MAKCIKTNNNGENTKCDHCGKKIKKGSAYRKGTFSSTWYCGTGCVKKSGNEVDNSVLGKLFRG